MHFRHITVEGVGSRLVGKLQEMCHGGTVILERVEEDTEGVVGRRLQGRPIPTAMQIAFDKFNENC